MLEHLKKIMGLATQSISHKIQQSVEELDQNFKNSRSIVEDFKKVAEKILETIEEKQGMAIDEIKFYVDQSTRFSSPEHVANGFVETISVKMEKSAEQISSNWNEGAFIMEQPKQANPNGDLSKQGQGKGKKLNLLNPQGLFQQYAIDQIFSFEKLARDIVEITKEKDPNIGPKSLKPMAPKKKGDGTMSKTEENQNKNKNRRKKENNNLKEDQTQREEMRISYDKFSSPISKSKFRVTSKIGQESVRRQVWEKSKEIDSQLFANLEFLKNMRGSDLITPKKQTHKTIEQIRQNKRKHLQSLGFSDPSGKKFKIEESQMFSPQRSDILPQIKNSRKRGQIYKPLALTIFTIQRN